MNYKKGLWIFLGFFIIFLLINLLIGKYFYQVALYHEIFDILIPCLIYLKLRKQPILSTLQLDKGINKKSILLVFQLFLVSFLLKFGINYIVLLTGEVDPAEVTTRVIDMVPNLFAFFIGVAVVPVFLEEVIMRGIILGNFKDTTLWQGSVITGLLFGFMHVDLGQLGYTAILGVIMGAIVIATGSLWGSILFHFFNNFLTFAFIAMAQLIEKFIPGEYTALLTETESSQSVVKMDFLGKLYGTTFAILCLGVGIFLTIHLIKKLQKYNAPEEKAALEIAQEPEEQQQEESKKKVSWKALFFNLPFALIFILYVSINWLLRSV